MALSNRIMKKKYNIGIIGLGYVGLPLFIRFSNHHNVTGFDLDKNRVNELASFFDRNKEFSKNELIKAERIKILMPDLKLRKL